MFWTNFIIDVLLVVFVIACPLMWLVILMQRSKQEGLGAAFGGGFTESVWGAQTSNVLVKATVVLAISFFILSIALARLYTYQAHVLQKPSTLQQDLLRPVAPMTATNAAGTPLVPTATPMTTSVISAPAASSHSTSKIPVTSGGSMANPAPAANGTPAAPVKKP